jgi:formamidase
MHTSPIGERVSTHLNIAPVEGRISGIVDIPNVCATVYLPTEIFAFDISPTAEGPTVKVSGGADLASVK